MPNTPRTNYRAVLIGASWGGVKALQKILRCLRGNFALPILVVLHVGNDSDNSVAQFVSLGVENLS